MGYASPFMSVPHDRFTRLAPLCAAAAIGRKEDLVRAALQAIHAGCTGEEVRDALLTLVPFCGFPRTLDAIADVRHLLPAPLAEPETVRRTWTARGLALFNRVYGKDAEKVRTTLKGLDPDVADWIVHDAYGKVLSRPQIPVSVRERIAVVLLAVQGLRNQVPGHIKGAVNCGATVEQVNEFLDAASKFIPPDEYTFAREAIARLTRDLRTRTRE